MASFIKPIPLRMVHRQDPARSILHTHKAPGGAAIGMALEGSVVATLSTTTDAPGTVAITSRALTQMAASTAAVATPVLRQHPTMAMWWPRSRTRRRVSLMHNSRKPQRKTIHLGRRRTCRSRIPARLHSQLTIHNRLIGSTKGLSSNNTRISDGSKNKSSSRSNKICLPRRRDSLPLVHRTPRSSSK